MPNVRSKADILIITTTKVESQAVIQIFREATGSDSKTETIGDRIYHDLGEINGTRIFMALSEMGSAGLGASQQAVQKGIAALSPTAVIMVGIAFGVNENKQSIGDILVSQRLMLYDLQRVGTDNEGNLEIIPRGDRPHASSWLINRFQSADLSWDESIAKVRFGLILSGDKLADNIDFRKQLIKFEPEAIGGDMESAGLYVACQDSKVDWILVKAICDWADGQKGLNKDQRQHLAAHNAAIFVVHVFRHAPFKQGAKIPQSISQVNTQFPLITEDMVQLSAVGEEDCRQLQIPVDQPIQFILGEATRHPLLFRTHFTSISLVFRQNVLLLSWNGSVATIERVLNRERAYPLNDSWSSCLAAYRQATILSYRLIGPEQLYMSSEVKKTLTIFKRLVSNVNAFLEQLQENNQQISIGLYQDISPMIDEAEFAITDNDLGIAIVRLETALSTIHKLIIQYAPQGSLSTNINQRESQEISAETQMPIDRRKTILVVDDEPLWLEVWENILESMDAHVIAASTSTEALRAMVDHEFDLVITDLIMRPGADGREIALAAKRSSSKTKVIIISGYSNLSAGADLVESVGVDDFLEKIHFNAEIIIAKIKEMLSVPEEQKKP
jgi:nucleoside phosphorylase/ActR/RegA family two-component response regulator